MKKSMLDQSSNPYKRLLKRFNTLRKELEEQKKINENLEHIIEDNIKKAKTFRIWQFYCRVRKLMINILYNPMKIKRHFALFKQEGPRRFIEKLVSGNDQNNELDKNSYYISLPSTSLTNAVNETVSVVIPTKNAGDDFKRNIQSIIKQKRISKLEVIIVDNNSDDETIKIALSVGCKIIKIHKFSHSLSRNTGAMAATGEYIIFTVQDAYFPDNYAFIKIVNFIKENNLAAASGYQIPYKDADIFARWQFTRHYDFMNPKRQNIIYKGKQITKKLNTLGFLAKRKLINIDDVFSCFKSSIFKQYYFSENIRFAEDAEIALRLLRDNYDIGSAMFSKVHHSHNRDFLYHFKRTYADSQTLNLIFHQGLHRINGNLENNVYFILNLMIIIELNLIKRKYHIKYFWQYVEDDLKKRVPIKEYKKSLFYSRFILLLDKLDFLNNIHFDRDNYYIFKNDISVHWDIYSDYCKKNHYNVSNDRLLNVTSSILAGYLGELAYKISDGRMKEILGLLTESV